MTYILYLRLICIFDLIHHGILGIPDLIHLASTILPYGAIGTPINKEWHPTSPSHSKGHATLRDEWESHHGMDGTPIEYDKCPVHLYGQPTHPKAQSYGTSMFSMPLL